MLTATRWPATSRRRLLGAARRLARERDRQHPADEPADDRLQRNRLAERHEVALAIELRRRRADARRRCCSSAAPSPGASGGSTMNRPTRTSPLRAAHGIAQLGNTDAPGISSANCGNALSGSTTRRPRLARDELVVELEVARRNSRIELVLLRDVALHERNRDRRACGRRPFDAQRAPRRDDQRRRWRRGTPTAAMRPRCPGERVDEPARRAAAHERRPRA